MSKLLNPCGDSRQPGNLFFSRAELQQLLDLYSTRVMRGEWRDYAIDQRNGMVVFSVFRHTLERPVFTIAKLANGEGYAVYAGPQRIKRAKTLREALSVFEKRGRLRVVS